MQVWIALIGLLFHPQADIGPGAEESSQVVAPAQAEPMRYRGVERLLARFEAEAQADTASQNR